jgi:glycerol-3-phosphate dehydrogenase (NAD(P)+)
MASDAAHQAAVLGAGSWGTALAAHLAEVGQGVTLWGRDAELMARMAADRENAVYLPGIDLPETLRTTSDIAEALEGARYVIIAVPSHGFRAVVRDAAPSIHAQAVLVSATKGLENDSLRRMSEVTAEETSGRHPVVVLSGPSFAREVAERLPTALVAASHDAEAVLGVQEELSGPRFRLYASDDVVGVEIGGALKNVIAIASGVVESLHLGHNARSALITRGLAEMSRLACAMGARRETLAGLGGLGDLVLTCTGSLSRNRHVGLELGRGRPVAEILGEMRMVAEGVRTTTAALALGERYGVELPIATQMAEVLSGVKQPRDAAGDLMLRPQRDERDSGH